MPAPPPVTVRRATPADIDAVAPLVDAYRVFYGQPADAARARAFTVDRLVTADTVLLLAEDADGAPLGFTHLFPSFSTVRTARLWILNDLFVAPRARRQGVADALLAEAEDYARATGAVGLVLQTARDNAAAQALYRRRGWAEDTHFLTFERTL